MTDRGLLCGLWGWSWQAQSSRPALLFVSNSEVLQALATVFDDELMNELATTAQIFLGITVIRMAYDAYVWCFFRA